MIAATLTAGCCRLITGVQAQWKGCAPDPGQRIYFANHTSNLDFLIIWSLLPAPLRDQTRPVAAHDYWTKGRLRHKLAHDVFRAVLIERRHVTKSNNPLDLMSRALEEGSSLIIFPEGGRKRGDDPSTMPFKSGLYHLAKRHPQAALVPVFIQNMNRILPAGEVLLVPLICNVSFGKPLQRIEAENKNDFLKRAADAVMEAPHL